MASDLQTKKSRIRGGSLTKGPEVNALLDVLSRDDDWLILINADPDAMGAALALRRIISRRVGEVAIAAINNISRPDNMAMVRYLNIPLIPWDSSLRGLFSRFALVDSQPHHNVLFADMPFTIVIDHHPLVVEHPTKADFCDIRPERGSTCSILFEYLYQLHIRPGIHLATALQYGIRTDTQAFTRNTTLADMRAYQKLARYADSSLLQRIMRSEYLPSWLPYFSRAFSGLQMRNKGGLAFLGEVESPDLLVVVADFFSRVHGISWIAVAGIHNETVVCVFRGDGHRDIGLFAASCFDDLGTAGGHRSMARAEFPLVAVGKRHIEAVLQQRLFGNKAHGVLS